MPDSNQNDSSSADKPEMAQRSEFHFSDPDVEEQVQRDKARRQAELDAEMSRPTQKSTPEFAPISDEKLETKPAPPVAAPEAPAVTPAPQAQTPQAPAPQAQTPIPSPKIPIPAIPSPQIPSPNVASTVAGKPVGEKPAPTPVAATPPAPQTVAGAAPKLQSPNVAAPKVPSPRVPSPNVPSPQIPSPQVPSPDVPASGTPARTAAKAPAARPANAQVAGAAPATAPQPRASEKTASAVPSDVASAVKNSAATTNSASPDGTYKQNKLPLWRELLDKLDPIASWVMILAGAAGALALAYILWGIFGGNIGRMPKDPLKGVQIAENIALAGQVLRISAIAAAIASIILMIDDGSLGPGLAILGAALLFGSAPAMQSVGATPVVFSIIKAFRSTGQVLVIIGAVKYAIDVMRWLIDLPNRASLRADVGVKQKAEAAQQRIAMGATMFSPCWQLPFCREVIRKQCPAYLARKRCWKFGRGCYCDEEMISRIVRGESIDMIKAPTRMSRQGKPPCGRCYIFLEHQGMKYKMVSPLALPATIIGMFLVWPHWISFTKWSTQSLDGLWAKLSFSVVTTATSLSTTLTTSTDPTMASYQVAAADVEKVAQFLFGIILGFLVLIYLSKFIEWAIYKARW